MHVQELVSQKRLLQLFVSNCVKICVTLHSSSMFPFKPCRAVGGECRKNFPGRGNDTIFSAVCKDGVAEEVGFEPTEDFHPRRFSRPVH